MSIVATHDAPGRLLGATFHVGIFGCQMNKHDSETIAGLLEREGARPVESLDDADIVVFMTCCVREHADERLYGQVASMKNLPVRDGSPYGRRIVCVGGCIGQRDGGGLVDRLPHVDIVFGTHNVVQLPDLLANAIADGGHVVSLKDAEEGFPDDSCIDREHPWHAWLPISVGCDNFCTYCVVPYVRGREISRPLDEIRSRAAGFVRDGVKEITLLGQNVNSYGRDLYGEPRFAAVLDAVADVGVERIRFATSHPKDLTDEVIERFATIPSLMPALHLAVQSGSNRILQAMHRRYTREHYLELVRKVREACPEVALSTDVIVGFPGETEEDFQQTVSLVREVGYHQVFSFIYSRREGTPAAAMEANATREEIQRRYDTLHAAIQDGAWAANQAELGRVVPVLVEGPSKREARMISGKSPKNQTVHALAPTDVSVDDMAGRIVDVRIEEARTWYLQGTIVSASCGRSS